MGNSAACDVPTDTASVKQPQLVEISEVKLPSSTPPWRPDSTAASNLVWTALYEFETMARKRKVETISSVKVEHYYEEKRKYERFQALGEGGRGKEKSHRNNTRAVGNICKLSQLLSA